MGGVSVTHSYIGIAVSSDGEKFLPDGDTSTANSTSLFPVWTVTFDGECSFAEDMWTSCPANIGDLEVRILLITLLTQIETLMGTVLILHISCGFQLTIGHLLGFLQ